jgi:predicted acylesterase/phospholipase RssA
VRVLCLGGGGLRAAFEVPILEALLSRYEYDLIMGISAGAVNGVLAAQDNVEGIRRTWEASSVRRAISSVPGALALSHRPWHSVYSLDPLRERLEERVSLDRLRVDFACGVVVRETREYRMLAAGDMADDEQLCTAIVASSSIAGLMPPVAFRVGDAEVALYDGGHRHCVPPIPPALVPRVEHIDVVACVPITASEHHEEHAGLMHAILWAFENNAEISWQLDLDNLRTLRRDRGISIRVYAPRRTLGSMFDGRGAVMQARMEQGQAAVDHPLEL